MKRAGLVIAAALLLLPVSLGAYPWDKDMVDQPSEKAQESVAPPDPGAVPVDGGEAMPLPLNDDQADRMKDAAAVIPFDPHLFGTASNNGRMLAESDSASPIVAATTPSTLSGT